ncbi:hypothetical protein FB451DRAFT_1264635 [Mycena latifolia]|nr:hypothetical protein FB451DRAFT_1264635 [Mycena latifolia]
MTFRPSLTGLYRLICILCLAQIICSAWTMRTFGFTETGWGSGESQLMLMLGAALTIPLIYRLAVHTRRTDHRLSRVDKHIEGLGMLLCFWIFDLLYVIVRIGRRARAIHGEEMVPRPITPPPSPPPPKFVPAWALGTVAETESAEEQTEQGVAL